MTTATATTTTLHPNLARIAADYDRIVAEFGRGRLSVPEAQAKVALLVARDDDGVRWSIDPVTAAWRYRTRQGEYAEGTPPTYGYAAPSPYALSRPIRARAGDPDVMLRLVDVDEAREYAGGLRGTTRLPSEPEAYDAGVLVRVVRALARAIGRGLLWLGGLIGMGVAAAGLWLGIAGYNAGKSCGGLFGTAAACHRSPTYEVLGALLLLLGVLVVIGAVTAGRRAR